MAPEEHPSDTLPVEAELAKDSDAAPNHCRGEVPVGAVSAKTDQVVTAELVVSEPAELNAGQSVASSLDNVAAKGGAIGALVLGGWSVVGAFITPFSIVNAILGFFLGLWGTTSPQFRLAYVGLGLSVLGLILILIRSIG